MAIDISVKTMILTPVLSLELAVQSTARLDDIVIKPNLQASEQAPRQSLETCSNFPLFFSVNHCTALSYRDSQNNDIIPELFASKGAFVPSSAFVLEEISSREFQHNR